MVSLSPPSSPRNSGMPDLSLADQNMLLAQQLETAKTARSDINAQLEFLKKKYQGIQDELQFVLQDHTKLEKRYYDLESDLESSKQREEEALRKARELEFKMTAESKESELEKNKLLSQEEQLKSKLKTLQTQFQQRVSPPVTPNQRPPRTRSVSVSFSPPSYVSTIPDDFDLEVNSEASLLHEAKLANRTVRQQIKEISELKAAIRQLNDQLSILTLQESTRSDQIKQLNQQIEQLTLTNSSHSEEIESYQLLLEDRTLRGQFSLGHRNSFLSMSDQATTLGSFNLSSELDQAQDEATDNVNNDVNNSEEPVDKKGKDELQMLKDENKALALYISKILGKIMSNPVLAEAITANGDSRQEDDVSNSRANIKNRPSNINTTIDPEHTQSSKPNSPSRLSTFLSSSSTKVNMSPVAENKVSFASPPASPGDRKLIDQVNIDELTNGSHVNGTSQLGFRGRRSKSLSAAKHPALRDSSFDSENRESSLAGVFSFRNALKKVTGPWKTTTKSVSDVTSSLRDSDSSATIVSDSTGH